MGLSLFDLQTAVSVESVRALLLQFLDDVDFPVDAWQDESAARSFVETQSQLGAQQSIPVAAIAKMGFLSSAVDDFLDALIKSDYDLTRNAAIATVMPLSLINASATTYVKAAREIVIQAANGRNFYNVAGVSVTANATTAPVSFVAELPGSAGNVPAQDLTLVTPLAGVIARFDGLFTSAGSDAEIDPSYRERASSKWATLRTEKIKAGILNVVRSAAPNLPGVSIDDQNPRGAGTLDVYLAGENATAGAGDVALVQAALNPALFGTGTAVVAGLAIAAPVLVQNLSVTAYVRGLTPEAATTALLAAWRAFLLTVPVGGFDLRPGPQNVILPGQITDALGAVPGVISSEVTSPNSDHILVPLHTKVLEGVTTFTVVVLSG